MKLFKLLVALIVLCFIGLFTYQNMEIWRHPVSFKLNLYFNEHHDTQVIEQYMVILLSALIGFIVGLALLLKPHIKTRRLLKREQRDKKVLQEQLDMSRTGAESTGETAALRSEQAAAIKNEH